MSECVFCSIATGEVTADIVYEDDRVIALMDICPTRPGHAMIIPREHFPHFDDLPEATASRDMPRASPEDLAAAAAQLRRALNP